MTGGAYSRPKPVLQSYEVSVFQNYTLQVDLYTVKPVLSGHSKRRLTLFSERLSLNAGQTYCRMLQREHSAILSTFIKLPFVIKIFVLSILEWPRKTNFTVICI